MRDHKRGCMHICGNCGRVTKRDLNRHYCPVTAGNISYSKSADKCRFYIPSEDSGDQKVERCPLVGKVMLRNITGEERLPSGLEIFPSSVNQG